MAVVATTTYLFVDSTLTSFYVQGSQLTDRGAWSASNSYNPPDVVQIGANQYIALAANTDAPPTGIIDDNWSALVVVEEASGSTVVSSGSDSYARDLAEQALETAWIGTAIGSAAYDLAQDAYDLAVNGTNMVIAETGSRIAEDTAIYVYIGSVVGSFSSALIEEQGTRSQEDQFLQTQITIEAGTRAQADQFLATAIFDEAGTRSQEDQVLQTQIIVEQGTRSEMDQFLYNLILTSTGTAFGSFLDMSGSLATETASRIAADQQIITIATTGTSVANDAYVIACIGTNVAQTGTSIANSAYALAQIGTNTGTAAYTLAQSGSNTAWAAYTMAQIGTAIPNFSTGGTMSGNLTVPNVVVSTGTVPVSQAINGTLYYSMSGAAYQLTTASSAFQISASNLTNGASICVVIISDGTPRALTYDNGFSWFGTQVATTSSTSGKKVIVALACVSATGTNVLGGVTPQI